MFNKNLASASLVLLLAMGSVESAMAKVNFNNFNEMQIPVDLENKIIGTRIDDLVEVYPKAVYGLPNIQELFKKNAANILSSDSIDIIHDVFILSMPVTEGGQNKLELAALVKYKNGSLVFEKLTFVYGNSTTNLADYQVTKTTIGSIAELKFEAFVGLSERKLILTDSVKGIKLVFPIGVGSFDEGVLNEGKVSLLTPRFKTGFLDKRVVESSRSKPKYFKGKPFIRLLKGADVNKDRTPIGFHIEINDSFVRGFDSHGCMRLREMDLQALHDIIMLGDETQLPINVSYKTEDNSDSPILKRNKVYKTILNKGNSASPFFILDRDNLVQTTLLEKPAPVEQLVDDEKDNYEDVFSYDTEMQMKEQDQRRSNECKAKVLAGTIGNDDKSFKKCMDEGKRKETMADRIYRKYMGIDSISSGFDFLN